MSSRGYDHIFSLFDEMHAKALTPHPRSTAQLLHVLSLWDEVQHTDVLLQLCNQTAELIVTLNAMSDERFKDVYGYRYSGSGAVGEAGEEEPCANVCDDPAYFAFLDGGWGDRQQALDELICVLMKALGPDRGECCTRAHR